jgi:hypothetical protein
LPPRGRARTGRLIGIIWLLGSVSERSGEPALRAAPTRAEVGPRASPVRRRDGA